MAHYVKLFESIIHSTLWSNEPPATRVVWVTMLAMADSEGEVQASIPGLAKAAGVTLVECETALACFLSPDPYSRSKEAGGRRIQEIRGGWELINYKHYRHLKSIEQEKENAAERQRRARDRKKSVTDSVTVVTESHRESRHIEEEEEGEEEILTTTPQPPKGGPSPSALVGRGKKKINLGSILSEEESIVFDPIWQNWPERVKEGKVVRGKRLPAEKAFKVLVESGATLEELSQVGASYHEHPLVREGYVQLVSTFFGEGGWCREGIQTLRSKKQVVNA